MIGSLMATGKHAGVTLSAKMRYSNYPADTRYDTDTLNIGKVYMISVKNLQKRYGDLTAVDDVSFEVAHGEIVGLLGHNGAGKTTVMKVMTGFLEPTRGTISVGGIDVVENRIGVQRQIGYMPEKAPLYGEMLVQEYLLMMAELRGVSANERLSAVGDAVIATGLTERLVQPISTLSKGYRQRVALAQAILHKPSVLVLDEPTNGLDPVQILEIRALIRRLAKTTTVIISTHILSEIEAVCNRVVILIDGNLAADSPLDALLSSNIVRLVVDPDATQVEETLMAIDGVEAVSATPTNNPNSLYRIRCAPGLALAPEVARVAHGAGWSVSEVRAETPSLEQVFRDLMAEHVNRARDEENAA
jgi:ABC-2 type transport system ATP-binding protein